MNNITKPFDLTRSLSKLHPQAKNRQLLLLNQNHFKETGYQCFRTFYYSIFLFTQGQATFRVGPQAYEVKAGDLVMVGPGEPYQWKKLEEVAFEVIVFNEELFENTSNSSFFYTLDYFCPDQYHVICMEKNQMQEITSLWNVIKLFKENLGIIPGLLQSFLVLLQQFFTREGSPEKQELNSKAAYVASFRALLAKNAAKQRSVSFYADKLHITSKYLSELLVRETGWTAKRWIDHHLKVEATSLLSYTDLPIKQIAHQLGFEDVSNFTKTFKKWSGITPGDFRSQNN